MKQTLTPARAVIYGHLLVTLPVLVIIGIATLLSLSLVNQQSLENETLLSHVIYLELLWVLKFSLGVLLGGIIGWLWWSFTIPRWRQWAKHHGADQDQTQSLAQRTLLVWSRGSLFEKTEFTLPKHP